MTGGLGPTCSWRLPFGEGTVMNHLPLNGLPLLFGDSISHVKAPISAPLIQLAGRFLARLIRSRLFCSSIGEPRAVRLQRRGLQRPGVPLVFALKVQ